MKQQLEILIDNETLELEKQDFAFDFSLFNAENPETAGYTRSYTIRLTATGKNNRLLKNSISISIVSNFIYSAIPCIVRLYGLELGGATLLITKITNKGYECVVVLGKSQLAESLSGKTLQDLNLGQFTYQTSNMNFNDTTLDYINAFYYNSSNITSQSWYNLLYSVKTRKIFNQIVSEAGYTIASTPPEMDWLDETYIVPTAESFDFEEQFKTYANANYAGLLEKTTTTTIPANTTTTITFDTAIGNPLCFFTNRFAPLTKIAYRLRIRAKISNGGCFLSIIANTNISNPLSSPTLLHNLIEIVSSSNEECDFQIPFVGGTNVLGSIFVVIKNDFVLPATLNYISLEVTPLFFPLQGLFQYNLSRNLPAASQRDFLKNILYLSGCVFNVDLMTNEIKIFSLNAIVQSLDYQNWTNKIDWQGERTQDFLTELARLNRVKFKNSEEGSFSYQIGNPTARGAKDFSVIFDRATNVGGTSFLSINIPITLQTDQYEFPTGKDVAPPQLTENETDNINISTLNNPKRKGGQVLLAKLGTGGNYVVALEPNLNNLNRIIEGNFKGNAVQTFVNFILPSNSKRLIGINDLSDFISNFSYTSKIYDKYKVVVLNAFLSISDILNLSVEKPIFIGGDINRRFILVSVKRWSGSERSCQIELLLIDEN